MASKVVVLALVLVAIVGVAAASDAPVPSSSATPVAASEAPASDDVIGTTDGNDDAAGAPQAGGAGEVVPGPLGSASAEGPSGQSSAGAALQASAAVGVAAFAGCFVF